MNALVYVVLALAAYRIARVPTKDSISLAWRERLYAWAWDDENAEVQHTADGDVFVPKSRLGAFVRVRAAHLSAVSRRVGGGSGVLRLAVVGH